MANLMPFAAQTNFGASGSAYGSETQVTLAAGTSLTYLTASSNTQLTGLLPGWFMVSTTAGTNAISANLQYSPDSGTTWRNYGIGSGTLVFLDGTASWRIINTLAGAQLAFLVPIKR